MVRGIEFLGIAIHIGSFVVSLVVCSEKTGETVFKTKRKRKVGNKSLQTDEGIQTHDKRVVGVVVFKGVFLQLIFFVLIEFRFKYRRLDVDAKGNAGSHIHVKDVLRREVVGDTRAETEIPAEVFVCERNALFNGVVF